MTAALAQSSLIGASMTTSQEIVQSHKPTTSYSTDAVANSPSNQDQNASPVAQYAGVGQNLVNVSSSFDGVYFGYSSNKYAPPDVQVAVGPNYVVEMVNVLEAIYTKSGSFVKSVSLNTFFSLEPTK